MKTKAKSTTKDPIEVYCRIRPLDDEDSSICLKPKDRNTIVLFQPDIFHSSRVSKEIHYSFKEVFDSDTTQKELFDRLSLPLVEEVLQGGNGLIFTYGITSSGKTYTMTGTPKDGGLLPRSLDVIFNSIKDYQTPKFVFKPDKLNGFEVQSFSEAMVDQQKETRILNRTVLKLNKREKMNSERTPDVAIISQISSDVRYAIFVSYIEVYNNYIYDLLEESPIDLKKKISLNSKMLREDIAHNMYVFGVTENEIKTVEEALDLFYKGQLRRRVSHTALNTESSRSHSVFTIRVVQAPLDPQGAEILLDRNVIQVSQLSLVDLAGSERCVRTKNTGQKLREAGNINASLMALRTCIEMLRESQTQSVNRKIPYRESKLTHLFKNYFEGEGKIKMVVCVNPLADYYDEIIHVMKFAEMTQDVVITRSVSTPVQLGLTPGRGKIYREAIKKAKDEGVAIADILSPTVYSLGPEFPTLIAQSNSEAIYNNLLEFLLSRMNKRNILEQDLQRRQNDFRNNLIEVDNKNAKLKQEKSVLKLDLESRNQQLHMLEDKLVANERSLDVIEKQLSDTQEKLDSTELKLQNANMLLSEQRREVESIKIKMQDKLASEKDRMKRIMERRLAEKQAELERKMCFTEERFRQLREILNADDWDFFADVVHPQVIDVSVSTSITTEVSTSSLQLLAPPGPVPSKMYKSKTLLEIPFAEPRLQKSTSASNVARHREPTIREAAKIFEQENRPPPRQFEKILTIPGSRHRRSKSNQGGKWIEHKPIGNLELGTMLQPTMKRKKSVNSSELKVKDFIKSDVSKYVLEHQEQDSRGQVEMQLYKADVIPSVGGGAQVIFNDVEKLKTTSPPAYYLRKRSSSEVPLGELSNRVNGLHETCESPTKIMKTG